MKKVFEYIKGNKEIILLILLSVVLRFFWLGYSDFQGDEIKALFRPEDGQSNLEFLLDQRKGPLQFIITAGIKVIDPDYDNRFLVRFPFALAGVLSVYYFYEFLKLHFNKRVSLFASLFFTTNGFLIAFSRIVQYQSFVILFMIMCLYYLSLSVKDPKYKITGLYLGLISWAVSILSHYDGVFIAPFVFYLLIRWFISMDIGERKENIKHFLLAGTISTLLLLIFYVPFVFTLSSGTKEYWSGRISGEVSTKLSSSKYLFTVYQPIYVIHIYTALTVLGCCYLAGRILPKIITFFGEKYIVNKLKDIFPFAANIINKIFSESYLRFVDKDFGLVIWLLVPLIFLELIVYIPGTHIYTYLIPLMVILGFGMEVLLFFGRTLTTERIRNIVIISGISLMFSFIFFQSYFVFVDHSVEYPWQQEKFLLWTFPKPTPIYHLSMFGFPYFRNWEGIEDFVEAHPEITAYSTNERKSIARYHIKLSKDSEKAGFFVYIKDPQSFTNDVIYEKPSYWIDRYPPDYTFTRGDSALSRVYIMETGSLEEIIEKGY